MRTTIFVAAILSASMLLRAQQVVLKSGGRINGVLQKYQNGLAYILVRKDSGSTMLSILPESLVDKSATEAAQKPTVENAPARPAPTTDEKRKVRKWTVGENPFLETSKLTALQSATKRAQIVDVVPGSVAEKAGLQVGDTIDALDGRPVTHLTLTNGVELFEGHAVDLTVVRGEERTSVQLRTPRPGQLSDIGAEFRPESGVPTYTIIGEKRAPASPQPPPPAPDSATTEELEALLEIYRNLPPRRTPVPLRPIGSNYVVLTASGCDYFVVEAPLGFALLELYSGMDPYEGDVLAGDVETYGFKDVHNLTWGSDLHVWVDDYWMSQDEAIEKLYERCN